MRFLSFLIVLIVCQSCSTGTRLMVSPLKTPCADATCLQVRENKNQDWVTLVSPIEGFTFEEGYEYELLVEKANKDSPLTADTKYKMKKIRTRKDFKSIIQEMKLANASWLMTSSPERTSLMKYNMSLDVDATNNKISGKGPCNRFFATISFGYKNLRIENIAGTKIFCPESMADEKEYYKLLETVVSYEQANSLLMLKDHNNKTIFSFSLAKK